MKKFILSALLAVAAVAATRTEALAQTACPTSVAPISVPAGVLTGNITWSNTNIYLINGNVVVGPGAVLTIQPGTIIKGDRNSNGTLIVARGGRLEANGTATQPIVFTSNQPAGSRARGDWGGIIMLGRSQENVAGDPLIEGVAGYNYGPGFVSGTTGAENAPVLTDNSGTLRYVRIEFPGILISTGNEINGLTLGGVGSGTTIDHVQVSFSGDDSFEWFGGTVNAKHLISYGALDDDFDSDNGFAGNVQFGLALRDPSAADVSDANGFESDNDRNGSNATPQTAPVFSNMSLFLPSAGAGQTFAERHRRGAHIRRNSALSLLNSVIAGPYAPLLNIDAAAATGGGFITPNSETQATNGNLVLKNNVFAIGGTRASGSTLTPSNFSVTTGSTFDLAGFVNDASRANLTTTLANLNLNPDNFGLVDLASAGNCGFAVNCMPDFSLPAASPLVAGASFTDAKVSSAFFDNVAYRGAFGPAGTPNWAAGWSNFNPQITCYNRPGLTLGNREVVAAPLQALTVSPNPTEGAAATLGFEVKTTTTATVRIVDMLGREKATILNAGKLGAGPHSLVLPSNLAPGVYLATVTTSDAVQSVRFVVTQ
ncbi:T9SS type A sorting domain-containing protein [Hymenobacter sp. BT683]|uniref:T9SS type A sorting domain-containing protein n=1 Tax=Hymenobacter jeongseonensis TaxID=2791027 RepID=A0ABS0IK87_9BACT|nr:T9SS type A sorting domain-containing protein [Hymenobacter jeongseonensis]MBF9238572.1 T9SS type A sorting domain-containing protein [Hymenobacter jeongseonensis]